MPDLSAFGGGIDTDEAVDSGGTHYREHDCHALTSSGSQCENSPSTRDMLCTIHDDAHGVRRVDEFESAPDKALQDELIKHCDIGGVRAYELSTLASTVQGLWKVLIDRSNAPLDLGRNERSRRWLISAAVDVSRHPALDVDDHLYAQEDCIALTSTGERCSLGRTTPSGLCRTHKRQDDVAVVEEFREQYAAVQAGRQPTEGGPQ